MWLLRALAWVWIGCLLCSGSDALAQTRHPVPGGSFETIELPPVALEAGRHPTFLTVTGPDGMIYVNVRPNTMIRFDPRTRRAMVLGPAAMPRSAGGQAYAFSVHGQKLYWVSYAQGDAIEYDPSRPWTGVDTAPNANPRQLGEIKRHLPAGAQGAPNSLRPTSLFADAGFLWSGMRITRSRRGDPVTARSLIVRYRLGEEPRATFWELPEFGPDGIAGLCMAGAQMWGASFGAMFQWDPSAHRVTKSFPLSQVAPALKGQFKRLVCGGDGLLYGAGGKYEVIESERRVSERGGRRLEGTRYGVRDHDVENDWYVVFDPKTQTVKKLGTVRPAWEFVELQSLSTSPEGAVYGLLADHTLGYIHPETFAWVPLAAYRGSIRRMNGWAFVGDAIYFASHDGQRNILIKYTQVFTK